MVLFLATQLGVVDVPAMRDLGVVSTPAARRVAAPTPAPAPVSAPVADDDDPF